MGLLTTAREQLLVLLVLILPAVQATMPPVNRCESARFESRRNFGQPAALTWTVPSAFPTPAHDGAESRAFQISCPEFSAEQKTALFGPGVFTIRGATFQSAISRIAPIQILEGGGCRYPALGRECWIEIVEVVIAADRLTFRKNLDPDSKFNSLADSVVGVRINNAPPRPVFFEGKLIPEVTFGPTDTVELSVKQTRSYGDRYDNVLVCRLAIDVAARTVTLQSPPPPYTYPSPDAIARACSALAAQTKKK